MAGRDLTQALLGREAIPWPLPAPGPGLLVWAQIGRVFHSLMSRPQTTKAKDPACGPRDGKSLFSGLAPGESSWSQHRQRRLQDHGKERKELLSLTLQVWLVLSVPSTPMGGPALTSLDFCCCVECGLADLGLTACTLVVLFIVCLTLQWSLFLL